MKAQTVWTTHENKCFEKKKRKISWLDGGFNIFFYSPWAEFRHLCVRFTRKPNVPGARWKVNEVWLKVATDAVSDIDVLLHHSNFAGTFFRRPPFAYPSIPTPPPLSTPHTLAPSRSRLLPPSPPHNLTFCTTIPKYPCPL